MTDKELIDKILASRKAKRQHASTGLRMYFNQYTRLDREIEKELDTREPDPVLPIQKTLFNTH